MAKTAPKERLRPLGDRIIVRRDAEESVTPGGIHLPDQAKERPKRGTVLAVGPGDIRMDGARTPPDVRPGDRVTFTNYAGSEIELGDDVLLVMREADILAVVETE